MQTHGCNITTTMHWFAFMWLADAMNICVSKHLLACLATQDNPKLLRHPQKVKTVHWFFSKPGPDIFWNQKNKKRMKKKNWHRIFPPCHLQYVSAPPPGRPLASTFHHQGRKQDGGGQGGSVRVCMLSVQSCHACIFSHRGDRLGRRARSHARTHAYHAARQYASRLCWSPLSSHFILPLSLHGA